MTRCEKMEHKLKELNVREFRGEFYKISELCDEYERINGKKISHQLMRHRLKVGWEIEDAMALNEVEKHLCPDGKKRTCAEIAEHLGISYNAFMGRIYAGYSVFEAFELVGRGPYRPRKERSTFIPAFTELEKKVMEM